MSDVGTIDRLPIEKTSWLLEKVKLKLNKVNQQILNYFRKIVNMFQWVISLTLKEDYLSAKLYVRTTVTWAMRIHYKLFFHCTEVLLDDSSSCNGNAKLYMYLYNDRTLIRHAYVECHKF